MRSRHALAQGWTCGESSASPQCLSVVRGQREGGESGALVWECVVLKVVLVSRSCRATRTEGVVAPSAGAHTALSVTVRLDQQFAVCRRVYHVGNGDKVGRSLETATGGAAFSSQVDDRPSPRRESTERSEVENVLVRTTLVFGGLGDVLVAAPMIPEFRHEIGLRTKAPVIRSADQK